MLSALKVIGAYGGVVTTALVIDTCLTKTFPSLKTSWAAPLIRDSLLVTTYIHVTDSVQIFKGNSISIEIIGALVGTMVAGFIRGAFLTDFLADWTRKTSIELENATALERSSKKKE